MKRSVFMYGDFQLRDLTFEISGKPFLNDSEEGDAPGGPDPVPAMAAAGRAVRADIHPAVDCRRQRNSRIHRQPGRHLRVGLLAGDRQSDADAGESVAGGFPQLQFRPVPLPRGCRAAHLRLAEAADSDSAGGRHNRMRRETDPHRSRLRQRPGIFRVRFQIPPPP